MSTRRELDIPAWPCLWIEAGTVTTGALERLLARWHGLRREERGGAPAPVGSKRVELESLESKAHLRLDGPPEAPLVAGVSRLL